MSIQYRKAIDQIPAYEPGKPIEETERELGIKVFAKLASNESAAGVSPLVVEAIRHNASQIFLYPDANCFYLVRELAEHYAQPENRIIVSAGSEDIIDLIAKAYIEPGDEVIMSQYAFVRYPMVVRMMEAHPVFIPPLSDLTDDFQSMVTAITPRTKAIILANPNNPIGTYVNRSTLETGLNQIPSHVMVVMDDAYAEYVRAEDYPDTIALQQKYPNIVSLRTFSKIFGLAGLRIGYGFAAPDIITNLKKVKNVFGVNVLAQAAAMAAMKDSEFTRQSRRLNDEEYTWVTDQLARHHIRFIPSQANFILIDTGRDGTEVFQQLLRKGIIVRAVKNYGLPQYVRVTLGTREQNQAFINEFLSLVQPH